MKCTIPFLDVVKEVVEDSTCGKFAPDHPESNRGISGVSRRKESGPGGQKRLFGGVQLFFHCFLALCLGLAPEVIPCAEAQAQHSPVKQAVPESIPPQPSESTPAATTPGSTTAVVNVWSFDAETPGTPPSGFVFGLTGTGAKGRWEVKDESDAPSGRHILAQLDTDDTDIRFPIAVVDKVQPADIRATVKCKMVSGRVDQACGLVIRYLDENNYYITRANALEGNIRLYHVKEGKRKQLASWNGEINAGVWHEIGFEANGERLRVFWNNKEVIAHADKTFTHGGRIGVWTKADSLTYFDDLKAENP